MQLIEKWAPEAVGDQAAAAFADVMTVRRLANDKLADCLAPVTEWMNRLAHRLDVEADKAYKARVNAVNPHHFLRPTNDAELAGLRQHKPDWVDETSELAHQSSDEFEAKAGYPDLSEHAPRPLTDGFKTFHGAIRAESYPPGTVLYRIVDPRSNDNATCWMRRDEFFKLKSKAQWRRRFAVKGQWNSNGEYVTYTVPPGKDLHAWEGTTASQAYENADDEVEFVLEGGATQIMLDPADLDPKYLSPRKPTGWGYSTFGERTNLVGVPVLKTNLYKTKD